ncbi:hypothetical protein GCM10011366_09450 [Ornithinimicrobium tianjinense]|uniref:ADP-ribosylglycohydrolase n=1 Tax=Ornithinimicrobium tianjinense TaxID=1195761 RepID=A0A917BH31_9MICO|nr:ADP-ribosylglycohydrolase family protein [Ornithinimicrobium tianjinense]GGF43812.1 hypothetical protein GCM10011366_09450 [Ornithinimicrobium tianjinense]
MQLSPAQTDRAAGVLLGQAVGDALGVPYEFGTARFDASTGPQMSGGGLGNYAPGEWSDDTQMAVCVAEVLATGAAVDDAALEAVADGFLRWHADGPADIGAQTSSVLGRTRRRTHGIPTRTAMVEASRGLHERTGRTAGNGALMRTAVVGLHRLDDRDATAGAARAIAELTHWDPLAGDSCVLWSEAVRVAVTEGVLDLRSGLDLLPAARRDDWLRRIEEAETREPTSFRDNGFTVTALQAAWSSTHHTQPSEPGPDHVAAALHAAIAIGHDTDTVAAIAGGLLGARYGVSGLPARWTRRVHGWPGLRSHDLVRLAVLTARRGVGDAAAYAPWSGTRGGAGSELLPEAGRGEAGPQGEVLDEVAGVGEAEPGGDAGCRVVGVGEEPLGLEDHPSVDELLGADADRRDHRSRQGALGVPEAPGVVGDVPVLREALLDRVAEP